MEFCHTESRVLQNCCWISNFQFYAISKRIKLETWDCAQMKGLYSNYRLAISNDPLNGYLDRQIPKTMGCVFFFLIHVVLPCDFFSPTNEVEYFYLCIFILFHLTELGQPSNLFLLPLCRGYDQGLERHLSSVA